MITLCIRYTLDTSKLAEFEAYARSVAAPIERSGGKVVGYYAPTKFAGPTNSALSLIDFVNPYEEIQIRGRVVERRPDGDLAIMDKISHKYTGAPFPRRDPAGRIVLVVEADRVRHHVLPFRHTPARA